MPILDADNTIWFILSTASFVNVILFFLLSEGADPGYLRKPKNISFLSMMQTFDPVLLCPDCEVIRTTRSRHCSICNRCVERFDHHCPWVNNCVGMGNHAYFMTFLFDICVLLVIVIATVAVNIHLYDDGELNPDNFLIILPLEVYSKQLFFFASITNIVCASFFLLPVL